MSEEAIAMQRHHERLLRAPRKTAGDRNRRFLCECGNSTTKKQLRASGGRCIYCRKEIAR